MKNWVIMLAKHLFERQKFVIRCVEYDAYLPKWSLPAQKIILIDDPCYGPAFPHTSAVADQIGSSITTGEKCLVLLWRAEKKRNPPSSLVTMLIWAPDFDLALVVAKMYNRLALVTLFLFCRKLD